MRIFNSGMRDLGWTLGPLLREHRLLASGSQWVLSILFLLFIALTSRFD